MHDNPAHNRGTMSFPRKYWKRIMCMRDKKIHDYYINLLERKYIYLHATKEQFLKRKKYIFACSKWVKNTWKTFTILICITLG